MFVWDVLSFKLPASGLQSIYQLGCAVSLAYAVAAPQVGSILSTRLVRFDKLGRILDQISADGGNVPAKADRETLIQFTRQYVDKFVDKFAFHTLGFYVLWAVSFGTQLAISSLGMDYPLWFAVLTMLPVAYVVIAPPVKAWQCAAQLIPLVDDIFLILRTFNPVLQTPLLPVKTANGLLAKALVGQISHEKLSAEIAAIAHVNRAKAAISVKS